MPTPSTDRQRLAQLARQRFVDGLCAGLPKLSRTVQEFLTELMGQTASQRDMQQRRDAWMVYQERHRAWLDQLGRAWRDGLAQPRPAAAPPSEPELGSLSLVGDDEVENKIVASRMALTVAEHVGGSFSAVRRRTQFLDGEDLGDSDILRPETLCLHVVEQWIGAGLPRDALRLVLEPLHRGIGALALPQYQAVESLYDERGVPSVEALRAQVRRSGQGALGPRTTSPAPGPLPVVRPSSLPPGPPAGAVGTNPFARARQHAQGVMAQLLRLLPQPAPPVQPSAPPSTTGRGAATFQPAPPAPPASAALAQALAQHHVQANSFYSGMVTLVEDYGPQAVLQVAAAVRERSAEFKKKATTASEKATIEVVALMFQSILSEDRIPPSVRVWFARLQVPVLRVALAEPEFFSNMAHPARQLIDRMGSCVLGFDASRISGSALESEIRRVVQVIEQYPETGRRVFELVLAEFEKFLAKFLTTQQTTSRIVSVAQQVEQKETLTIQYTIELRTLLKDMPVRDEIRTFLFKTWAEVLAVSAVRVGPQHADTAAYKHAAGDLVWAASAKPNRAERAQVVQSLPVLLQTLRRGLALVGTEGAKQDAQIKQLTDTLADAFLSKTAAIPQAHIDAMVKRLDHLEDYIGDAELGDMPLNADNIEMLLGIDASRIHVIADNGTPVQDDVLAWVQELPCGTWYTLDHNGVSAQVQYVWHSARRQLHLFAAMDGSSYLIQLRRLGAYLQTGLLVAHEEESLTLRATRDALTKLDANPERLLG